MIAQDTYVPLTGCINSAILNGIFLGKKVYPYDKVYRQILWKMQSLYKNIILTTKFILRNKTLS